MQTRTRKLISTSLRLISSPMRMRGKLDACVPKSSLRKDLSHKRAPLSPSCMRHTMSITMLSTRTKVGARRTYGDFSSGRLDR